ncbi:hypothetical protein DSCA_22570 [Desulfosarcina alkanivorans]|uniref:DUF11 domain-containing protein n=1 Tax=Desulfosarcina alkanivorans TaxID=571177 RepID=A0A5K7YUH6_9BACT|nr:hypothetical protein [Desulfosarcina alkanivorans]BBO68327.1 hypothetical protein DSCA_22570 [Desulfosarcina alkanivorans]
MKTKVKKRDSKQTVTLFWTAVLLVMVLAAAPWALASTAENTQIVNTVNVTWDDVTGLNSYDTDATSTVTVALLPSQPNIAYAPAFISTELTAANLTYTITGTANGDDTYTIALTNPANATVGGLTLPASDTTITDLGGTTLVEPTDGSFEITVPHDGSTDTPASINSIVVDDWIVIGGTAYQVTSITEADTSTTSTIQLSNLDADLNTLPAPSGSVGDIVGEQQTITIAVTTGAFPGTDTTSVEGTHDVDATISWTGDSVPQATDTVITVRRPLLTVQKFVQVAPGSAEAPGGGNSIMVNTGSGNRMYWTNIVAPPEATLEYIIRVFNGAATDATNVVIEDTIPPFTTYVDNSMKLDPGTGVFEDLNDTTADAGETDGNTPVETIWIYAGNGGSDTDAGGNTGTGGTIAAGATSIGVFQVTIY